MALVTVQDFINQVREHTNDNTPGHYRVLDTEMVKGLNNALLEARRLRPDIFFGLTAAPQYTTAQLATAVAIDEQFKMPLVYYMIGHAHLKDEEETSDSRYTAMVQMFRGNLIGPP